MRQNLGSSEAALRELRRCHRQARAAKALLKDLLYESSLWKRAFAVELAAVAEERLSQALDHFLAATDSTYSVPDWWNA